MPDVSLDPTQRDAAVQRAARKRRLLPSAFIPDSWDGIRPYIDTLKGREIASPQDLEQWLLDFSELAAVIDEYGSRRYIDKSCHTDDEAIKQRFLDFVENIEPHLKPEMFALQKKFLENPYVDRLEGPRYDILRRKWQADVDIFRPENVPLETKVTKIVTQYDEVCGAMTVEFRGKEYTMQQMARFQEETDRELREEAWGASTDRRLADRNTIDDLFDEVIELRRQIARNAGFDNARDYMFKALKRFDYTPADCDAFADAVEKHVVPLLRELDEERRQALGVDRLRPWDLAVDPRGRDPLRPFDPDNIDALVETTRALFEKLDPALAADFASLREAGNLDLDSRKGKQPGGYQCNLEETGVPFIFMNAAGLQRDVETLLHEGGHAFHTLAAAGEPLTFLRHAPMEFCEVASMSMELLALPYLDLYFDKPENTDRARRHQLEGVSILGWIAVIDQFQHWIYTTPGHSRDDRTARWNELLGRFHHGLDWAGHEAARDAMWQRQLHLFHVPFYYIEYGIAQLGALQIYNNAKKDPAKALKDYRHGLSFGGTRPLPELFEAANIKFDFGDKTVEPLMRTIREDLKNLPV